MSDQKLGQVLEKSCVHSRGHIFSPIIIKVAQNVCLDKILMSLKMGHVGFKNRSPGQILEIPCVCSEGHIFSPLIMKLDEHVCLDEISQKSENGSCLVKN